jgi:NADH:ubiquinone oxidoreductase subunit 6 (subunit J)
MLTNFLHSLQSLVGLWPIWLPLIAGGAAIYLLLPRPRAPRWYWGAIAGLASLVLTGVMLIRVGAATPETILFYAFSAISLTAGGLLVTQRNPARAALSFALVVLSSCGLFLLLAAPFLMAATIIVYAGAIIVTFLFVLMLAQQEGLSDADGRSREPFLATLTGFILLGTLLYVLKLGFGTSEIDRLLARTREAAAQDSLEKIQAIVDDPTMNEGDPGKEAGLFTDYSRFCRSRGFQDLETEIIAVEFPTQELADLPPLAALKEKLKGVEAIGLKARNRLGTLQLPEGALMSGLSGPAANTPPAQIRRDARTGQPMLPADNSAYLGRSLFTDYLLPVELGGTLLLVATIGAIAIAQRRVAAGRPLPHGGRLS